MLNVLLWLVAVQLIGLVVFPLCYYLFPQLRDRGYSVSKPLGILLVGYLSWVLSVLHLLPSVQLSVALILIVLGGLSTWYVWVRRWQFVDFVVRERKAILISEAVFLVVFLAWVIYRAYDPAIDHTEQPMDFAFLNASVRSFLGSPEDPWLRGESLSYYYFGYWMMGTLTKLTGIVPNVSYNLSLALITAMGAMGIFGLVYNMVRAETGRLRYAVVGGIAAALLLIVAANLEGVLEFMRANGMGSEGFWDWVEIDGLEAPAGSLTETWRPQENWWWWRATRVIASFGNGNLTDYTIHEFPAFSFILGDMHPHVMSIPFVILFLTFCWGYLKSPTIVLWPGNFRSYSTILALGLVLGGLGFNNMWDLPVFAAFFVGVAALRTYSVRSSNWWGTIKGTIPISAIVVVLSLMLILPYLLTFTSQVSGIGVMTETSTRPFHMFVVWALFFVAVVPLIIGMFWRTTVREDWARLTLISALVGFLPYIVWVFLLLETGGDTGEMVGRFIHVLPFALLISIAVYTALWLAKQDRASAGKVFTLALAALGLLLIMGPEMLYVDDSFSGAWSRMNTVFKLYYQSWIVLAVASGFAIYYWSTLDEGATGSTRLLTRLWAAAFVVLLMSAAYYSPAAATSKGNLFSEGATLDGLAYIAQFEEAEYDAIKFIRENADRDSAILEAVGGDYSSFGRVSASTGVPTVLGWPGHELQWRGSSTPIDGREQDVATIYQTQDPSQARDLLDKYDVDYVFIGSREREKYGEEGLDKFSSFMETVFSDGDVTVYRLRQPSLPDS